VREESNLHAEATGLQPAERTTCSTHGWGALRDSDPLDLDPQSSPSATWVKAPVVSEGIGPSSPVCRTGALPLS
jgi:hypothetical protein